MRFVSIALIVPLAIPFAGCAEIPPPSPPRTSPTTTRLLFGPDLASDLRDTISKEDELSEKRAALEECIEIEARGGGGD